jgi:cyclopropane-fatty-acyl-phospholipid synthase
MPKRYIKALRSLLAGSDVLVGGDRPWDIQVRDPEFARRILAHGSLGVGESYMDAQWDSEQLDETLFRIFRAGCDNRLPHWHEALAAVSAQLTNRHSRRRAREVAQHYDIGIDLYEPMLGESLIYTCAYWKDVEDLDSAQAAKLHLIARKLGLQAGMRVLDIGCGWGGAARFFARHYGVHVTGLTISTEQAAVAEQNCKDLPVEIRLQDYRDVVGLFDRAYCVGMFEHTGHRNHRTYFEKVRQVLADDGMFLLHTIGSNVSLSHNDPWVERYVFPNSLIPSIAQIAKASEGLFVVEDWHSFGPDYDRTLMAWHQRFEVSWPTIAPRYGEQFRRMWRFWLLTSAACFRARRNQLWQVLLTPNGIVGGAPEVR